MDSISGRIAKAIHPGLDIRIENFRVTKPPEGQIDAVTPPSLDRLQRRTFTTQDPPGCDPAGDRSLCKKDITDLDEAALFLSATNRLDVPRLEVAGQGQQVIELPSLGADCRF
jgi:hypothetical protein